MARFVNCHRLQLSGSDISYKRGFSRHRGRKLCEVDFVGADCFSSTLFWGFAKCKVVCDLGIL